MNLPDVTEMRNLIRHMTPAERDELHRAIFDGKDNLDKLSFHELRRISHLMKKLETAWPYCAGNIFHVTLTEMFSTFDDDEAKDYLHLCRWALGDERPAEHPPIADDNLQARRALERAYRPDQPLREAQLIIKEAKL